MMQFKPFFFSSLSSAKQALPKPVPLRYRIFMAYYGIALVDLKGTPLIFFRP
ncbi:MAG: hypothetical protein ABSE07_04955 [Methanoregula sp.]